MLLNDKISAKALLALLFYLIIPVIAISIIIFSYDELSKTRFINMIYWIIPTSIIIVIISQISIRYKKGENKRYFLNLLYVFFTLIWVYGFIGGTPILKQTYLEYEFSIHLWKYITLIITAAIINILYYTFEWRIYKKEISEEKIDNVVDEPQTSLNLKLEI
jgi:hypothetical protein